MHGKLYMILFTLLNRRLLYVTFCCACFRLHGAFSHRMKM